MGVRTFTSVADLESAIGEDLGPTAWLHITQDRINGFAEHTDDHQWIHVDVERAGESPFGGTIAHGYLTLSLIPSFGHQLYAIEAGTARLNYGLEKVRFPAPVPVGSRIRASARVSAVDAIPAGTRVTIDWKIESESGPRPVCVARTVTLIIDD